MSPREISLAELVGLLAKFENVEDHETDAAYFMTRARHIAERAYFSIVYKPVDTAAVSCAFDVPPEFVNEVLEHWNGARLFGGSFQIYGFVDPAAPVERATLETISMQDENASWGTSTMTVLGSYPFDGSIVCLDAETREVIAFEGRQTEKVRARWCTISEWIRSEVLRLTELYSSYGKLLRHSRDTLPSAED